MLVAGMKRSVKDSVFTYLFKQPEYTRQLYLALHPEDTGVQESDFKLVTLENVLTTGFYNDLGIQVRDRLILLVEAQSTFSVNIALRMLLYLAGTYKEYIEEQKLDLYGSHPVEIPRPELYVVYTGSRGEVPEMLRLSDLYQGTGSAELEVKVLRDDGTGDILDQYVRFCKIADAQREKYGLTQRAIDETIRIVDIEVTRRPHDLYDLRPFLIKVSWIEIAPVFWNEYGDLPPSRQLSVSVAPSRRLDNGFQRCQRPIYVLKVQIDARLDALSRHRTARKSFSLPGFYL